jgi:hypothetical protein
VGLTFALASIPALAAASTDPRLSVHDRAVALWLYHAPVLSVVTFAPLKIVSVQTGARVRKQTAIDSVHRLASIGYLQPAEHASDATPEARAARNPRWYRLSYHAPVRLAA